MVYPTGQTSPPPSRRVSSPASLDRRVKGPAISSWIQPASAARCPRHGGSAHQHWLGIQVRGSSNYISQIGYRPPWTLVFFCESRPVIILVRHTSAANRHLVILAPTHLDSDSTKFAFAFRIHGTQREHAHARHTLGLSVSRRPPPPALTGSSMPFRPS